MKTPRRFPASTRLLAAITALGLGAFLGTPTSASAQVTTGFNQTAGGTYDYNTTANWVDSDGVTGASPGDINGVWDASLTITGNQTLQLDADTTASSGFNFAYVGGSNLTFTGLTTARTLILGGDITHNTASNTRVINFGSTTLSQNLNIDLDGATRTFTVGSGRSLGFLNSISNGSLVTNGGTINFSGANTYSGTTLVASGTLAMNGASGGSANSDITVKAGGASASTLSFNSNSNGNTGTTRAKSVSLNGSASGNGVTLTISGNAGANSNETITNALEATKGFSTVTVSANAARNAQLTAGSFSRQDGATILLRGSDLGVSSLASQTAGDANIVFTNAPTLIGASSAGTSTMGIIKGAYGATATNSAGTGLVTYDATYGVRLLADNEYTTAIVNGQTQADNVRISRASGGASQDMNLTAALTTINSLSFNITGAGTNSGVTLSGDTGTTLRINSGMIFASQTVTAATATDAMLINVPTLDLNGGEGVIIAITNGINNGNTSAPLQINSSITNDGGKGVTIGGTGQVIFGGTTANTYTGPTTINSGILRVNKTGGANGLTTDLVMNGGIFLKNSNSIADTASVTINGGSFHMDSTTSSGNNNHAETINNLTMNGGALNTAGINASLTINGNANLNASALGLNAAGDLTVLGNTNLNGGILRAREANSTTVNNALTSLNHVNITNTASGAYTAITLAAHATNRGAQLTLNGAVTFTGNDTNANTVRIASTDAGLANQGVFRLEGLRTFNIGNGAAADDLTVETSLTDGSVTGGLVKSGLGTLALAGTNTYSGNTAVNAGSLTLADTGSLTFYIGANGVTNSVTGSASATFNGSFNFDLTNAVATEGNSWAIVDVGSLTTSFTGTFAVAGFTETDNVWTLGNYSFSEATGVLTYGAIPEPSAFALLAGAGLLAFTIVRRKPRAA